MDYFVPMIAREGNAEKTVRVPLSELHEMMDAATEAARKAEEERKKAEEDKRKAEDEARRKAEKEPAKK